MKTYLMALALVIGFSPLAASGAIITNGNVSLGVDTLGQLNVRGGTADVVGTRTVGVRWIDGTGNQYESTSHGCLCEGWGLAVNGTSGYANNASGTGGLTALSFTSTATTATSVVQITGTDVQVTHDFALAAETDDLYRVRVTVANTGATAATGLVYRRVMDWDTSPTPFSEYVTIQGTGTTSLLIGSSNDGFASANPLSGALTNISPGCGVLVDFSACGTADHGAGFDFGLADIAAGESYSFDIFYGGAANKTAALAALGAVGAELYSMGWSGLDPDQNGFGTGREITPTFLFAFKGVGGTIIVPPPGPNPVPLPAAGWLLLAGLGALAAKRRRCKLA